ncbi:hypothetical protein C0Q70_12187 [Pomacea canaliculata]|uniref:Uncharacterized protein n=1 Tax=Pomacea canaliculata TaxID=400727 RepID=A0A2T7P0T6_POMCA|nr:hypothetical protein C0Q70_12187 [Pomacea canaliculata]
MPFDCFLVNVDAQTSGAKISTGASSASGQSAVIQTVSGYQPQIPTLMYQVPFPGPLMQQNPASGVQQASPVVQQTLPLGGPMWIQQPQQAFNNQPAQVVYSNQLPPFPLQPTQVLQQIQHPNAQVVYVLPHPSQPVNQPYFSPQVLASCQVHPKS